GTRREWASPSPWYLLWLTLEPAPLPYEDRVPTQDPSLPADAREARRSLLQEHDPDDPRVALGHRQRVLHLGAHARRPRVQGMRTAQRDGRDGLGDLVGDLLVHARRLRGSSPRGRGPSHERYLAAEDTARRGRSAYPHRSGGRNNRPAHGEGRAPRRGAH